MTPPVTPQRPPPPVATPYFRPAKTPPAPPFRSHRPMPRRQMKQSSALTVFSEIAKASMGKQIVMFLDYDGTLSPIVDDADHAFMSKSMRDAVRGVARHFPTAIVSGRCRYKVYNFVRLAELYYLAAMGWISRVLEKRRKFIKNKAKPLLFLAASEFLPMIDEVYKVLTKKIESTPGATVENKFCVSVHFRCVAEKNWSALAEQVRSVLEDYPMLKLTTGRKVFEICPMIKWDKGKALEFLLESLGFADSNNVWHVYIGNDRTDEDAFKDC